MNTTNDFKKIVIENIPTIDVRSPGEFEKGAFLNAVNLPIMNDYERHLVGICYKEKGNEEATKLGHQLVSGNIKLERIDAWISHINKYPNSLLYCFRGGLRSKISQEWITEALGKEIIRLDGGYKAFRNYLIEALDPLEQKSIPILLGGYTGSGKTLLLNKLKSSIDLEGIAHHRGSSFGNYLSPQPSQIDFENNLAYALIKHRDKGYRNVILEDESSNIGKNNIPKPLFEFFRSGNLVILEVPFEERVQITLNEYVTLSQLEHCNYLGEELGYHEWFNYISSSIHRIRNRLGGDCFKRVTNEFELAYKYQMSSGSIERHKNWLEILLKEYYDPMYNYQMQKTIKKVIFKGNTNEVFTYLDTLE